MNQSLHKPWASNVLTQLLILLAILLPAAFADGADGVTVVVPDQATWFDCGPEWPKGCQATLVAGDPAKETSVWYCKAPKGALFARHSHSGAERILVVTGRVTGGADGMEEKTVSPGMYIAFDGKVVHWARCEDDCLMYIIHDGPYDQTFH
jgi:quercetin dioxygenase-like cupin family protein